MRHASTLIPAALMRFGFVAHPGFKSPSLRHCQVDDARRRRARVREHPGPPGVGAVEPFGRVTFASGEPHPATDRHHINHVFSVTASCPLVDRRQAQVRSPGRSKGHGCQAAPMTGLCA
jgi:hypothetical protein